MPKLVTDAVMSLRPWPVTVTVAGHDLEVPALPAVDWLELLMDPGLTSYGLLYRLLPPKDAELLEEILHTRTMDVEDFPRLGFEVLSQAAGRPWWVAMRLVYVAQSAWDALGGEMMMRADPTRLSLAGWLDVLFLMILRNIEDSKRSMFLLKLELVPEGWGAAEEMEMSADAFLAMAGE